MLKIRLRELREEFEHTQAYVAKEIGIGTTAYSNYERGLRVPDAETLLRMAKFFDCSTDYLLGNSPYFTEDDYKQAQEEVDQLREALTVLDSNKREHFVGAILDYLSKFKTFKGSEYLYITKLTRFLTIYKYATEQAGSKFMVGSDDLFLADLTDFERMRGEMFTWVNDFVDWLKEEFIKNTGIRYERHTPRIIRKSEDGKEDEHSEK